MFKKSYFNRKTIAFNHEREKSIIPIAAAGAIWVEGLYNNRMLPALIVDLSDRPDVRELLRVHKDSDSGDVEVAWGREKDFENMTLYLHFERPVRVAIILLISLKKFGLMLDHMVDTGAFYLQSGDNNTKISDNPNADRIVVSIPDTGFRPHWDKILKKFTAKVYGQKGMNRAESKRAAEQFLAHWRDVKRTPEGLKSFLSP